MIEYRVATARDAFRIGRRLREADRREVEAASGWDALTAVLLSHAESDCTWVALVNGFAECIFGIAEVSPDVGCPWMVGTDVVPRHARELLVAGRSIVADMQSAFPVLKNYVHVDNKHSILWLKRLGFKFGQPEPYGFHQQLFIPFVRHRHV